MSHSSEAMAGLQALDMASAVIQGSWHAAPVSQHMNHVTTPLNTYIYICRGNMHSNTHITASEAMAGFLVLDMASAVYSGIFGAAPVSQHMNHGTTSLVVYKYV